MNEITFAGIIATAPLGFTLAVCGLVLIGAVAARRWSIWKARRRQKKLLDEQFAQILGRANRK